MNQTIEKSDERLNSLVDEVSRLTGENLVTAMCQALEERRDRLVGRRSGRKLRLSVELVREPAPSRNRDA
jgi:hypothetical protein